MSDYIYFDGRNYFRDDGSVISKKRVIKDISRGILKPVDGGLFGETPQDFEYTADTEENGTLVSAESGVVLASTSRGIFLERPYGCVGIASMIGGNRNYE